jgi:hypothetical protein
VLFLALSLACSYLRFLHLQLPLGFWDSRLSRPRHRRSG